MIKGVNRQVLEVVNTENPYFERIVFYVKPEYKSENAQFLKSEAEKFSQSVQKPPKTKRPKKEIGMHAIRGGTIVGEHEIIFAGRDEIVKLSHSARSKEIFAVGSVNAAIYLKNQDKGIYNMSDLLSDK